MLYLLNRDTLGLGLGLLLVLLTRLLIALFLG